MTDLTANDQKSVSSSEFDVQVAYESFKVISKRDEIKWNLLYDMAQYANHHIKTCIPEKLYEEQLSTYNLVISSL